MIKFGTDGWRAVLDEDFNKENVARAIEAIGSYIYEKHGFEQEILIGYDPRKDADFYAEYSAKMLSKMGFRVTVSSKILPTPVLAYNALVRKASAIMFTASHNPAKYLGLKYIPEYAGPATTEITDRITGYLDNPSVPASNSDSQYAKEDFFDGYYKHIKQIIDIEKIKTLKTNIIFDGLYSASIGYFDKILEDNGIRFKTLHLKHDINFGGMNPDPKTEQLSELTELVKSEGNSIGLANDGDADRFGVIDENGSFVSPNVIIAILLKYLHDKGYKGAVVKTVGSSVLIDNVAKSLGVEVIETAVGFKHVGEAMRKNDVIIGGEESGGLSIKGHIPEKDGLLANLLILEAMAVSGKSLVELEREISEIGGKFYTERIDISKTDIAEVKEILGKIKGINTLGRYKVTDIDLKDGVKLMFGDKTKILARPSGTEPLLRIYFEAESGEKIRELQQELDKIEKIL